jgi:hypothetical protein
MVGWQIMYPCVLIFYTIRTIIFIQSQIFWFHVPHILCAILCSVLLSDLLWFLENESYFMKRQFKNCIPFIVPYPINRPSHNITWKKCRLKRSWPIQTTKPADFVLECDSLYNNKKLLHVCSVLNEPVTFWLRNRIADTLLRCWGTQFENYTKRSCTGFERGRISPYVTKDEWENNKTSSASDWAREDFSELKYVCFSNYS